MKFLNYLLLIAFVAIVSLYFFKKDTNTTAIAQEHAEEEYGKLAPNDWMFLQRAFPNEQVDKTVYRKAKNVGLRIRAEKSAARNTEGFDKPWVAEGPTNIGGRISSVAMPVSDPNKIYAGVASGGIFLSEDAGQTWNPIFDDALSLSIGDIAIAPSNENILYVGTGEANAGGGSLAYDGEGVYKSTDAGQTWTAVGLAEVGSIGKVIIHPDNPNTVFIGAMGDLFGDSPHQGVYKSTNGGLSWDQVLFLNDSTGVVDMAINPDNPDIVYAAAWQRVRRPHRRSYGGAASGIYRSVDGGETWQELTNGLPTFGDLKGRIGIALAPSQPNTLYATYADAFGFLQGNYRSNDGGNSWFPISISGIDNTSFMWWFGKIAVDPLDPETVYHIGFLPKKSTDGGITWNDIFINTHVDQHALAIHPSNTDYLVLGNDGGVYISEDGGESMVKADNMAITQFYTCEIDESFPERLYGGTQDNSTMRTLTGNLNDYEIILGGDGFYTLIDPTNNAFVYAEFQYGNLRRSVDGGNNFLFALSGIPNTDRKNWNSPVAFDPANPSTLYFGTQRLYKTFDRALNWAPVTGDLTNGSLNGNIPYGTLTTIGVSTVNTNIVWVGTDDGNVWVSQSGGSNMTKVSDSLPLRWVTRIVPHPEEENTAYLTLSGFRYDNNEANIYKTTDLGQTWQSIASDLPDVPVNDLIVQPESNTLFIATDIGVFYSIDDGINWDLLGTDMPLVVVTELDYHHATRTLLAATFGRSLFTYELDETTTVNNPTNEDCAKLEVFPNPFHNTFNIALENTTTQKVKIDLFSSNGQLVRTILNEKVGIKNQTIPVDATDLANGTYHIVWNGEEGRQQITIVKQ